MSAEKPTSVHATTKTPVSKNVNSETFNGKLHVVYIILHNSTVCSDIFILCLPQMFYLHIALFRNLGQLSKFATANPVFRF